MPAEVWVRLTVFEGEMLVNATGFGGPEPSTPRELAALDRAIKKVDRAKSTVRRSRRTRRR